MTYNSYFFSIIKAGLDETAMTEAGEADTTAAANINNDLTTVTWTSDEKEDLKKEDDKIIKDEKETEKEEVKEEKKEETKEETKEEEEKEEEKVTEETPLNKEEEK